MPISEKKKKKKKKEYARNVYALFDWICVKFCVIRIKRFVGPELYILIKSY
jgi:hypothetical protein